MIYIIMKWSFLYQEYLVLLLLLPALSVLTMQLCPCLDCSMTIISCRFCRYLSSEHSGGQRMVMMRSVMQVRSIRCASSMTAFCHMGTLQGVRMKVMEKFREVRIFLSRCLQSLSELVSYQLELQVWQIFFFFGPTRICEFKSGQPF